MASLMSHSTQSMSLPLQSVKCPVLIIRSVTKFDCITHLTQPYSKLNSLLKGTNCGVVEK